MCQMPGGRAGYANALLSGLDKIEYAPPPGAENVSKFPAVARTDQIWLKMGQIGLGL